MSQPEALKTKTGKRKGKYRLLIGLVFGILVGLGYVQLKSFLLSELIGLLQEELDSSCHPGERCKITYKSASLSLLSLTARAEDIGISSVYGRDLQVKEIHAGFSLLSLLDRRIPLRLDFTGAHARGVGEDSVVFRYIDHLAAPIPPERDRPDRIKVYLTDLTISDSSFEEPFNFSTLKGLGISMQMGRNENDDFVLLPIIRDLRLVEHGTPKKPGRLYQFGTVKSTLVLPDDHAVFETISLFYKNSNIKGAADAYIPEGNALSGTLELLLTENLLYQGSWLKTIITGEASLAGSLGKPAARGRFRNKPGTETYILPGDDPLFTLSSIEGDFDYAFSGDHHLKITGLEGSGDNISIKSGKPFILDDISLSGSFSIEVEQFPVGPFKLQNISGEVAISGTTDEPLLQVTGSAKTVDAAGLILPSLDFSLKEAAADWKVELRHSSDRYGNLDGRGSIRFEPDDVRFVDPLTINLRSYNPIYSEEGSSSSLLDSLRIDGAITVDGTGSADGIRVNAPAVITARHFVDDWALGGNVIMRNGRIDAAFSNKNNTFAITGDFDVRSPIAKNSLYVRLSELPPLYQTSINACLNLGLDGSYHFPASTPQTGSGTLSVLRFQVGCSPYTLSAIKTETIPIEQGALQFNNWVLQGPESTIRIKGKIHPLHGYDLTADGRLQLSGFLPYFPVDDIFGSLDADLHLSGPFDNYLINGSGTLENGGLYIESADLDARDFSGSIDISQEELNLVNLSGKINEGNITAAGHIDFQNPSQSRFSFHADTLEFAPSEEVSFSVSGDLDMARTDTGKLLLSGALTVNDAVVQKQIDLQTVLRQSLAYLLSASKKRQRRDLEYNFDDILLDVDVFAPRNLFLVSSVLSAELSSNLAVTGTLSDPRIDGELKVLSGWFGIKDAKFEITSGDLVFSGSADTPTVELVGETSLFDPASGSIYIIAEARGPLDNPRFSFTSDSGHSHNEILALLTTGSAIRNRTRINTLNYTTLDERFFALQDGDEGGFSGFFSELTAIDEVNIEPQTNPQTGVVEPVLQVKKEVLNDLSLIGENFLSGTDTGGRLKAVYDLSERLSLIGIADTATVQDRTTLGMDVIFTILADKIPFLILHLDGNEEISDFKLKRALRLNENSRVPINELENVAESVKNYYQSQGFFSAEVFIACHEGTDLCKELAIAVHEGPRAEVREVILTGDPLPRELQFRTSLTAADESATASFLAEKRKELITALRAEGYIRARVDAIYSGTDPRYRDLELNLVTGKPVTFQFPADTRFSHQDFLETINLFERRQPFGRNTINLLIKKMERMYRDAGYLYTTISYEESENQETGRTIYYISIRDDESVPVLGVNIQGNQNLTRETILRELQQRDLPISSFLKPKVASREIIDQFAFAIEEVYQSQGYPDAVVKASIEPDESDQGVVISYNITEGEIFTTRLLVLEGWPKQIAVPEKPKSTASVQIINSYLYLLLDTLRLAGFHTPGIRTESYPEHNRMKVIVIPGQQTSVGDIQIEGNQDVPTKNILKRILIKPGDPWNDRAFYRSRSRLLKLGLFSRVEFSAADGVLDSEKEDLLIKVVERPLNTLEVGGGINSELGIHILAEGTDKRLFKDGTSLSLSLDTYYNDVDNFISQGTGSLRFLNPYVFGRNLQYISELRFQRLDLATLEFDLNRFTYSNQLVATNLRGLNLSVGHSFMLEDIDDVSEDAILGPFDSGTVRLSFLTANTTYDRRDNPINPRSGYFLGLNMNLASETLYSEADFLSIIGRGAFILPLTKQFQMNNHTRVGYSVGYNDTDVIPITQRFYTGGRTSIRGFRENSLGPRGENGSVLGGDVLFNNNFELRYYILDSLAMLGFWDTGTVFLEDRSVEIDDLRHGVGLGARYFSPIGPIGVDLATPLEEQPGERSLVVHFNVGTLF